MSSFQKHVTEAEIIARKHAGFYAFISHITLLPSNKDISCN